MDEQENEDCKQCGEAFLTLDGMIIFHCTLCENKYDEIQNFGIHIINKHIDFSNVFEILESEIDSLLPVIPDMLLEQPSLKTEDLRELSLSVNEDTSEYPTQMDTIEITNYDTYDQRCGEIHLTKDGVLIFSCTLCDNNYKGVKNYSQHVIGEHYSLGRIEEVNFEILCTENEENNSDFEINNTDTDANNVISVNEEIENKGSIASDADEKRHSNTVQNKEKLDKPVPKWKQMFESFYCSKTNMELYKCKLCSTIIKNKSNVNQHISRIHEQIRRFECPECHKLFHAKTEFKIHLRYHTGEKPYLCVKCGMTYVSNSELQRHFSQNHTKALPEKACSVCGKKFFTQKYLSRHMKVHSDERPFKCKVCNSAFKMKTSLRMHNRIHEDKRMFKCAVCSASYNYKSILDSHMKTKHYLASE